MLTLAQLTQYLQEKEATFALIEHAKPILSVKDAEEYFDSEKAAPVFIMKTDKGLIALVMSAQRGKIDFKRLTKSLGFSTFKMADQDEIKKTTGYEIGSIPLIGHELPCIFDKILLDFDFIYGGTGDAFHTLKIAPQDILRLSQEITILEDDCTYLQLPASR